MNTRNKLYTALLGAAAVLFVANAAVAQSEMTSKVRIENNSDPSNKYDFEVVGGNLAITRNDGTAGAGNIIGGKLGLGLTNPTTTLHISGSDGTTKLLVQENNGTPVVRELFKLQNNGGPFFIFTDNSLAKSWAFASLANNDFTINQQQSANIELRLTELGNLTIEGTLTQGSSREIKTGIESVDTSEILARVLDLPIAEWSYKGDSAVRHMGPMAEDFSSAFGLGSTPKGIAPGDTSGIALAAIQGLHQELVQRDATIAELARQNEALLARLTALEEKVAGGRQD
jgi:hypothetical protein